MQKHIISLTESMKNSLTDIKLYFCINKVILKELLDDKLLYCDMVCSVALKILRKLDKKTTTLQQTSNICTTVDWSLIGKSLSRRVGVI